MNCFNNKDTIKSDQKFNIKMMSSDRSLGGCKAYGKYELNGNQRNTQI